MIENSQSILEGNTVTNWTEEKQQTVRPASNKVESRPVVFYLKDFFSLTEELKNGLKKSFG